PSRPSHTAAPSPRASQPPAAAPSGPAAAVSAAGTWYRVQVGAFRQQQNAAQVAQRIKEQGYPAFVSTGPLFRVQAGAFQDRTRAEKLKRKLASQGFDATVVAVSPNPGSR
ncbi:MAG: SPOR domain-containing protein, partial [Firmicutes bacterium]|nr:SPOR domain-containing protein [Bacillota bacterium]